ncbi:unnamed protein product [Diabrotica balteata]|uniref:Uncharacterized protein n=1 Tax=Diabrotica balteata TaxID=107213 RepID=A0A9N9SWM9_DIABA|nr:unnamed protein product [Diabrotica balteata]
MHFVDKLFNVRQMLLKYHQLNEQHTSINLLRALQTIIEEWSQINKVISKRKNLGASEVLLELMVRIASHPDQWDRVHKLLQTIDQDLRASRNVVEHVQSLSTSSDILTNNLETSTFGPTLSTKKQNISTNYNRTLKIKKKLEEELPWPNFDESDNNVKFVNSSYTKLNETQSQNLMEKAKNKTSKSAYPKNFTYHRVTGKPDSTSKNPKAYIAVSIIAPKSASKDTNSKQSDEEVTLENELHQLKPWSHVQNLKNMESIRSKWHVKKNQKKGNS